MSQANLAHGNPVVVVPEDPIRTAAGRKQDRQWSDFSASLTDASIPFQEHWEAFRRIYARRPVEDGPPLAWTPSPHVAASSNIRALQNDLGKESYSDLYAWSVSERPAFIERMVDRLGVVFANRPHAILGSGNDPRYVAWFPEAEPSAVDSCFTAAATSTAIIYAREDESSLTRVTYGDLERLVNRAASGFRALGCAGKGVALYMPMTIECVVAYLAIIRAGGHVISIADSFSSSELRRRLELTDAAALVTVGQHRRDGKALNLYTKVIEADGPRAVVIRAPDEGTALPRAMDVAWEVLLDAGNDGDASHASGDDTINVLFSSGTTGRPKVIPWTHVTPIKCALDGHLHQDIHAIDVVAWPTNIGWMMGPWLIFATLMNRAAMALFEGNPGSPAFVTFVREAGVSVLGVVPSLVRAWRRQSILHDDFLKTVRLFSSTGEASNREDYLWLMSRAEYRAPVIEYLGGTEIGGGHITGTIVQPCSPAMFTTPTLGTRIMLLADHGRRAGPGEQGEMYITPPALGLTQRLVGQDHDEIYYAGAPAGPQGEVMRRHGDQMAQLANGFVRAHGRADDTMNLSGIKVSSREIETVVDNHPDVVESAAVAVQPSGEGADHLVLFVVLEEDGGRDTLTLELQQWIGQELNPLFRIHDLVPLESLPRTASNKVMRRELRARYP